MLGRPLRGEIRRCCEVIGLTRPLAKAAGKVDARDVLWPWPRFCSDVPAAAEIRETTAQAALRPGGKGGFPHHPGAGSRAMRHNDTHR